MDLDLPSTGALPPPPARRLMSARIDGLIGNGAGPPLQLNGFKTDPAAAIARAGVEILGAEATGRSGMSLIEKRSLTSPSHVTLPVPMPGSEGTADLAAARDLESRVR